MRYLGVDPGGRRLGLAFGDDASGVVTPLEVLPYHGAAAAAAAVAERARRLGATTVVVGLPALESGEETPACRRSHLLAEQVRACGLEVVLQAELLTTDEARRRARAAGRPQGRPVDDLAAQVLLEEHLDHLATVARPGAARSEPA